MEVLVKHFDEIVDGLKVRKIILLHIHANTEVEASVAPENNLTVIVG